MDIAVEALGKAATFKQAVLSVREGGRAVMVGLAPFGVGAEVDISKLVRREVCSVFHLLCLIQLPRAKVQHESE